MSERQFKVTGRFVLLSLIGFFGVVFAANAIFISFAVRSFPGEQEEKSYFQGLNYNDKIEARERQAELGWRAEVTELRRSGDALAVVMAFSDAQARGLGGLAIEASLMRPASDADAGAISVEYLGAGSYVLHAPAAASGVWVLTGAAHLGDNEPFKFEKRLVVE